MMVGLVNGMSLSGPKVRFMSVQGNKPNGEVSSLFFLCFVHRILVIAMLDWELLFKHIFLQRWYAKRFLHPDIVAEYDYIFIWDEDLGVEHFDAEE